MGGAHPFEPSDQMRRRIPPATISAMAAITKPGSTLRRMCHIHLFFNILAAPRGHGFLCQPLSHCVAVWQHREKSGDNPKQRCHCIGPPIRGNGDLFHIESSNKEALDNSFHLQLGVCTRNKHPTQRKSHEWETPSFCGACRDPLQHGMMRSHWPHHFKLPRTQLHQRQILRNNTSSGSCMPI